MTKALIKRLFITVCVIIVGFVLQTSFFSRFALAGVSPNILLILTVSFGLLQGPVAGMLTGCLCGLICDFYSESMLGLYFLLYLYLGYLSGQIKRWFYGEELRLPLLLIGAMDVLYGSAVYLIGFVLRQQFDVDFYYTSIILPEAIYTMLVAIFIYHAIFRLNRWFERDALRGSKDLV